MGLANRSSVAVLLLTVGLHFAPAGAQSLWLDREHATTFLLEAHHVDIHYTNERLLTGVAFLDARHEVAPGRALVVELPFTRYQTDPAEFPPGSDLDFTQSSVGNVYLGLEISGNSPLFGEIGARAPLMSDSNRDVGAEFVGLFSDLTRSFAFFPNTVPVQAALNLRTPVSSDVRARLRFGPTVTIPTESGPDTELYGVFAWEIGYEGRYARIGSALSGWTLLTGDYGNLGYRTAAQFEFHADFGGGRIRPGAELNVPFGIAAPDFTSSVVGLSLAYFP